MFEPTGDESLDGSAEPAKYAVEVVTRIEVRHGDELLAEFLWSP
ncbi:hypothetical protein ACFL6C_07855 [Myxococcota bacterium]